MDQSDMRIAITGAVMLIRYIRASGERSGHHDMIAYALFPFRLSLSTSSSRDGNKRGTGGILRCSNYQPFQVHKRSPWASKSGGNSAGWPWPKDVVYWRRSYQIAQVGNCRIECRMYRCFLLLAFLPRAGVLAGVDSAKATVMSFVKAQDERRKAQTNISLFILLPALRAAAQGVRVGNGPG